MFLTVHAASGVLIGQATGNVWLALIGGIISHFLLDLVPHGDQDLGKGKTHQERLMVLLKFGIVDTVLMLTMVGTLLYFNTGLQTPAVLIAIFGALIPDAINASYLFFKLPGLTLYSAIHTKVHFFWNGFTVTMKQGYIIQTIFLMLFLSAIILY